MFEKVVFPSAWTEMGEATVQLLDDRRDFTKVANTIFGAGYDELRPDKDHVGIHLVALGDYEHFGLNRNKDGFTKASCIKYHPTFVKCGHVFEHHKNKDPNAALGTVVKSAYNEHMGRVELLIHAHREKAAEHLEKYERDGEVSFSMACRIPFDVCTKCGSHRKNRKDPNACDHLKFEFGKFASDGTEIGTLNPDPIWFDISFVNRPADRIAWDLKKVASEDDPYMKWAQDLESGLTVPDRFALTSASAVARHAHMKGIAAFEQKFAALEQGLTKAADSRDAYYATLKQAGASELSDATVTELRRYAPDQVFRSLAANGVVMSPTSFFKYAFGTDFGEYKDTMPDAIKACANVFSTLVKNAECQGVCNNDRYDITDGPQLPVALMRQIKAASAIVGPDMQHRAIYAIPRGLCKKAVDNSMGISFNTDHASRVLAEEYAAYKVAAVDAVLSRFTSITDTDSVYAVAASQNLFEE